MKNMVVLISLFLFLTIPSKAITDENPIPLIKNLGFDVVFGEAPTFDLPDLKGKLHKIDEYKGKWLVLAFWATWCGPCRMELPELEKLYTKLKLKNFNLVGISADQSDVYNVQKFVAELKLTFPILHDLHGEASSAFQANALPTLYLISPDLKLVGIASGARSWSNETIVNEFEKLTAIKSVEVEYFKELAEKLKVEPPVLEVEPLPEVYVNDSLLLKVKIHWKGEPAKYIVTVPKINFPSEIMLNGNIGSSTSATSTEAVLNYIYPVLLNKVGTFQTGPIIMSFRSAAGGPEQFSRHPGVEIMVKSRSWNFVFALSIVVSLIIFMIFFIGKRKNRDSANVTQNPKTDWENILTSIKRLRLEGSKQEYTLELLNLSVKVYKEKNSDTSKLNQLIEKIRFGGLELSETELDYYEKELKRALEGESI